MVVVVVVVVVVYTYVNEQNSAVEIIYTYVDHCYCLELKQIIRIGCSVMLVFKCQENIWIYSE